MKKSMFATCSLNFILISFCLLIHSFVFAQQKSGKHFILATYTYSTNTRLQNLEPLANYLTEKTGITIKAVSYPTVQSLIDAIAHDSVDFAMMNTSGYLTLQRNYAGKVTPMVNLDMGNSSITNYGGCLIASKSSGIRSYEDIIKAGKISFALVNNSSTSGNLVPRLLLNSRGITNAEKSLAVYYAGTHRKVTEDVIEGKAQIGGCGCAEIDTAKKKGRFEANAVLIGDFNNIPLGPIVYNSKTKKDIIKKINAELLSLHVNNNAVFTNFCAGWTEFKQATRFKPVSDADYNDFRKMFGDNKALWKLLE